MLRDTFLYIKQTRLACLVYVAMGSKNWRKVSIDEIQFQEKELKDQLIPVLRKHAFRNDDWLSWTNQLLADCKTALKHLFPFSEHERAFLQSLFEDGTIDATNAKSFLDHTAL